MRLHYRKVSTIYIYSVIADVRVRLLRWQHIHSSCIQSAAHHGPVLAYNAACSSYKMILGW